MNKQQDKEIIEAYGRVFTSKDGQIVLDHIRLLAKDRKLASGTPEQIFCNVGAHDLVVTIENYVEVAINGKW